MTFKIHHMATELLFHTSCFLKQVHQIRDLTRAVAEFEEVVFCTNVSPDKHTESHLVKSQIQQPTQ